MNLLDMIESGSIDMVIQALELVYSASLVVSDDQEVSVEFLIQALKAEDASISFDKDEENSWRRLLWVYVWNMKEDIFLLDDLIKEGLTFSFHGQYITLSPEELSNPKLQGMDLDEARERTERDFYKYPVVYQTAHKMVLLDPTLGMPRFNELFQLVFDVAFIRDPETFPLTHYHGGLIRAYAAYQANESHEALRELCKQAQLLIFGSDC